MSERLAAGRAERFLLELELERAGGPPVGLVRTGKGRRGTVFHGWIALMIALERLREEARAAVQRDRSVLQEEDLGG